MLIFFCGLYLVRDLEKVSLLTEDVTNGDDF